MPPESPASPIREWVDRWKSASRVMEKMRGDSLRNLGEQESARWFNDLDCPPELIWRRPGQVHGLVEQQRLFSKLHARKL